MAVVSVVVDIFPHRFYFVYSFLTSVDQGVFVVHFWIIINPLPGHHVIRNINLGCARFAEIWSELTKTDF